MSLGEEYWRYFCGGYTAARSRFLHVAEIAGARLTAYRHPRANGPQGEPLYVDVAEIGPVDAPRIHLAVSGTHGLEAAAGSAVQVAWLSAYASKQASLPPDTAVVLVHSINPYGFAWGTRTTENNVDLNRNFVDHDDPSSYPANPDYARLHQDLVVEHWDEEHLLRVEAASQAFREAHGDDAFFNARAMGQYQFADGLAYGGRAREWSNQTLQTIVESHLRAAQQVAFIDWHTGLGDYAQPFFLCFNAEGSALQREAVRWWSEGRIIGQRPNGLKRPDYQGLLFQGVKRFLAGRPMVGAVVEFGSRTGGTGYALWLDQWLRFKAPAQFSSAASAGLDAERNAQLRADLYDAFVPVSAVWRRAVVDEGLRITAQAISGLASWHA